MDAAPDLGHAALAELLPVVVDLVLVAAGDLERDRLVEREIRAAVEREELLAEYKVAELQAAWESAFSLWAYDEHLNLRAAWRECRNACASKPP